MKIYRELEEAIREKTDKMQESEEFRLRFLRLLENYMDGMGAKSEIADMIDMITFRGEDHEN